MPVMPETRLVEITRLHDEIEEGLRVGIEKAIRIGELLTKEKERLGYGKYQRYVRDELPFCLTTLLPQSPRGER